MLQVEIDVNNKYTDKWSGLLTRVVTNNDACKTSAHVQGLYFQNSGCECELHNKNAFFELKSNFISIQNFKAGNLC